MTNWPSLRNGFTRTCNSSHSLLYLGRRAQKQERRRILICPYILANQSSHFELTGRLKKKRKRSKKTLSRLEGQKKKAWKAMDREVISLNFVLNWLINQSHRTAQLGFNVWQRPSLAISQFSLFAAIGQIPFHLPGFLPREEVSLWAVPYQWWSEERDSHINWKICPFGGI